MKVYPSFGLLCSILGEWPTNQVYIYKANVID